MWRPGQGQLTHRAGRCRRGRCRVETVDDNHCLAGCQRGHRCRVESDRPAVVKRCAARGDHDFVPAAGRGIAADRQRGLNVAVSWLTLFVDITLVSVRVGRRRWASTLARHRGCAARVGRAPFMNVAAKPGDLSRLSWPDCRSEPALASLSQYSPPFSGTGVRFAVYVVAAGCWADTAPNEAMARPIVPAAIKEARRRILDLTVSNSRFLVQASKPARLAV